MSITVNTNMQALRIQGNLSNATSKMDTAMERMSSGYKINSSKDDAAGLAVSTKLETTVSSSKVASDNVQIGSNLLETSEGTLDVIQSNLQRIRDLTEQAANGTYSDKDKAAIATEVDQRVKEIYRSATKATFNDINLFDSTSDAGKTGIDLQVGTQSTDSLNLESSLFKSATVSAIGMFKLTYNGAGTAITGVSVKDTAGTVQQLFSNNTGTAITAIDGTNGAIEAMFGGNAFVSDGAGGYKSYNIAGFLNNADDAINEITSRITKIGAYQNRLDSISDNLEVQQTNLTAANSTIKDADVAEESAAYVQAQILQQASASLLVQANSAPQIALTLIQG